MPASLDPVFKWRAAPLRELLERNGYDAERLIVVVAAGPGAALLPRLRALGEESGWSCGGTVLVPHRSGLVVTHLKVPGTFRFSAGAGVVDVALRVPEGGFVLGLGGGGGVPGADDELVVAGREVERRAPVAPGPGAQVLEQLGLCPGAPPSLETSTRVMKRSPPANA